MFETLVSQVANGLVLGFLYVVISLGLTIVFGLLGIVNAAHGAFFTMGAFVALALQQQFGWIAVPLAPIIVGIIGMVIEVVLLRRLHNADPLPVLVLTFALALLIEAVIRFFFGPASQPFPTPDFLSGVIIWGPILITTYRVAVLGAAIVLLLLLWALMRFTPFGRILRAGSRDPEMVALLGINLPRIQTVTFGIGCLLAAAAGLLAAPLWSVAPSMGTGALMPAFVIVTIGGLGSYLGAIVAGLLVGIVTALAVQFAPALSTVAMYVLMAVILLIRQRGLFGERWERFE
ncbi:MAG: branched-chain amino acid ABC transporter permease [Janthinobacterium lividum]